MDADAGYFLGLQPSWWREDRVYRVYVSARGVVGGWVAGQIHDVRSAGASVQGGCCLAGSFVRQQLDQRAALEALYDTLDPWSDEFAAVDRRNLRLPASEIGGVALSERERRWRRAGHGVCDLRLTTGRTWRFVLLHDELDRVRHLFAELGQVVAVERGAS